MNIACLICGRVDKAACEGGAEADECIARLMFDQFGTRDNAEVARILAMSDENILAGTTPERIEALMTECNKAIAAARQQVVRDCACCSDQPTPPKDCPACGGRGGFGPYASSTVTVVFSAASPALGNPREPV